jgi:hypothetical protein
VFFFPECSHLFHYLTHPSSLSTGVTSFQISLPFTSSLRPRARPFYPLPYLCPHAFSWNCSSDPPDCLMDHTFLKQGPRPRERKSFSECLPNYALLKILIEILKTQVLTNL